MSGELLVTTGSCEDLCITFPPQVASSDSPGQPAYKRDFFSQNSLSLLILGGSRETWEKKINQQTGYSFWSVPKGTDGMNSTLEFLSQFLKFSRNWGLQLLSAETTSRQIINTTWHWGSLVLKKHCNYLVQISILFVRSISITDIVFTLLWGNVINKAISASFLQVNMQVYILESGAFLGQQGLYPRIPIQFLQPGNKAKVKNNCSSSEPSTWAPTNTNSSSSSNQVGQEAMPRWNEVSRAPRRPARKGLFRISWKSKA